MFERRELLKAVGGGAAVAGFAHPGGAVDGSDSRPERHVVGLEPGADPREVAQEARRVRHVLDFGSIGTAVAGRFPERAIERFEQRDDVRYVEEEQRRTAQDHATGDDPYAGQVLPWGIDRVDADVLHHVDTDDGDGDGSDDECDRPEATGGNSECGKGEPRDGTDDDGDGEESDPPKVAIIDSGIDPYHESLEVADGVAYVRCGHDSTGEDDEFVECDGPEWSDDYGHGTHVAGTVAALDNGTGVVGVDPRVELYALKVLSFRGAGSDADIAAALEWSVENDMDVANLSIGGPQSSETLEDACRYAYENGVLLVSSAGNDGPAPGTADVNFPGAYDSVVAVGSVDPDGTVSDFSSRGAAVELVAPGADVLSTYPDDEYERQEGTSMAAPHVAGAGATLVGEGYPHADDVGDYESPGGARGRLREMAEDLGEGDGAQGHGLVDVAAIHNLYGSLDVEDEGATASSDSVTVTGNLVDFAGETVRCSVHWRREGESSWNREEVARLRATGEFTGEVDGLESSTTYEYRLHVENDEDAAATEPATVTTTLI